MASLYGRNCKVYAGKRLTVTIFGNPSTRFWVILSIYQVFESEKCVGPFSVT